jgi:hypothetical protein
MTMGSVQHNNMRMNNRPFWQMFSLLIIKIKFNTKSRFSTAAMLLLYVLCICEICMFWRFATTKNYNILRFVGLISLLPHMFARSSCRQEIQRYKMRLDSSGTMFIPSFMRINHLVQKLTRGTNSHTKFHENQSRGTKACKGDRQTWWQTCLYAE